MKIILLALTGLGNGVLKALLEAGNEVLVVVTRKERAEYPYFSCKNLVLECEELGQPHIIVPNGGEWVSLLKDHVGRADLVISATFHRIVPVDYFKNVKYGIFNIHTSLLPRHKGPTPVFWAIKHGDKKYGFTVHEMTNVVDAGRYVFQKTLELNNITIGSAKEKLYSCIIDSIPDIISSITSSCVCHSEALESYESRPTEKDFKIDFSLEKERLVRSILSVLPYPGLGN